MDYFEQIKEYIKKYEHLGIEVLNNGTTLVGKAPHVAEMAWSHELFSPLSNEDILKIENEIKTKIPESYKKFLLEKGNGIRLFVTTFSLYGLRKELGRTFEAAAQPFSIITPNTIEKPKNAKENHFFIGGYGYDASKLYIDTLTGKVHYSKRRDATSLFEWNSFEEMLLSEVKRIFPLFDEQGKELVDDIEILPV
jgi:SMI1 / KNR4 family (SUKH-1)